MACHLFDPTQHLYTHIRTGICVSQINGRRSFILFSILWVFLPRANGVRNRILNIVCAGLLAWLIMFAHICMPKASVCICVYCL